MPLPPRIVLALLAMALLAALVVVIALSGTTNPSGSSPATAAASSQFDGAALGQGVQAKNFTLSNESGQRVSLSDDRGRVTILTFLYSTCGASCVLIAQQIRGALDELDDEHAPPPAVLIVSADPAADTPARVARFLEQVSLAGRVQYLTGPAAQLRLLWRAYGVHPASSGRGEFDRFASVLLLDGRGRKRVLFQQEQLTPEALAHDVRILQAG